MLLAWFTQLYPLLRGRNPWCLQIKLSDRNIVELVNKLQECGLLGDDLLHTVNGREYVTTDHLKTEVTDAVNLTGGRTAVVGTCATVHFVHCERHEMARKSFAFT